MQLSFLRSSIIRDYPYMVSLSFIFTLFAAYFSIGAHHGDEHFQILEFANARLGNSDVELLPWEFEYQSRPALQPAIAMLAIEVMHLIGIDNPFSIAFLIRLFTGMFTWLVGFLLLDTFISKLKSNLGKYFLILATLFIWFGPYLNVRFSSEIMSGYTFILGFITLIKDLENPKRNTWQIMLSGLLFGLAFYFRFQIAGAIIGLSIWLLVFKKYTLPDYLNLLGGGLIAAFVCTVIDFWFYDAQVITPWNYFQVQIVEGKAAEFGVDPIWHYFPMYFTQMIPPISLFLFFFAVIGGIQFKRLPLIWIIIPFILIHMAIGHKEMRFLFPIYPFFIILASFGFDYLVKEHRMKNVWINILKITFGLNLLLLVFRTFSPANELISYQKYLYNLAESHNQDIVYITKNPYDYAGLELQFYKSPNIEVYQVSNINGVDSIMMTEELKNVLYFHHQLKLDHIFQNSEKELIYSVLPGWITNYNYNDWQSRSNLYSIYKLTSK